MLKNRLVITFTTVHGSRQYSLGQVARFLLIAFVVLATISVFVSNPLLFSRSDDLKALTENHQRLSQDYELILGSQQLYREELTELSTSLMGLELEKSHLEEENYRIGELNETLDEQLGELNATLDEQIDALHTDLDRRLDALNENFESSFFGLEKLLGIETTGEMDRERAAMLKFTANQRLYYLHNIPNGVPIQARRISDRFGSRIHPVKKTRQMHNGIDFKADIGTPVYATADAVVEYGGFHDSGFGKLIILQHNFGFKTYYAHLNKVSVRSGQYVKKGHLIGYSGNTGVSTGPHLHYEIRRLYKPLDPEPFLAWSMTDFNSLFEKVKDVKWASLKSLYPLNQTDIQLAPQSLQKETSSAVK